MSNDTSFLQRILGKTGPEPAKAQTALLQQTILDFAAQSEDQKEYAKKHLARLVRTLQLTPRGTSVDRILEMGVYMQITAALRSKLGYGEVRGSYLGELGTTEEKTIRSASGETFHCYIDLFDAERDTYPYQDQRFATVVCCELIEHLSEDPMHLMSEVHRILKPGGHFVVSTPNICSLRAVGATLLGEHPGFYPHYIRTRKDDLEPRHAREYTPDEMRKLFENSGFAVKALETGPYGLEPDHEHDWVRKLLKQRKLPLDLRDETIHIVGRKTGAVKDRFPSWLYD